LQTLLNVIISIFGGMLYIINIIYCELFDNDIWYDLAIMLKIKKNEN